MIPVNFPTQSIRSVIDFVWDNEYCDLYKKMWREHGISKKPDINNYSDFAKLPTIARADLNVYKSPDERCFLKPSEKHALAHTTGTTSNQPFFVWRYLHEFPDGFTNFALYHELGLRTMMLFGGPQRILLGAKSAHEAGMNVVSGDAHNLAQSAHLAKVFAIDSLAMPATLAILFADALEPESYCADIKGITLYGEYCSDAALNIITSLYPNARIVIEYGLAEAAIHTAYGMDSCSNPNRHLHLFNPNSLVEVIDGEITITTLLLPYGMPLIRYRTGDAGELITRECRCGVTAPHLSLLGRIKKDFIRIGAGQLTAEELDRVMQPLLPYIAITYTLEVDEVVEDSKRLGLLTLLITIRENVTIPESSLSSLITKELYENLRLSQNLTLGEAVTANFIKPLQIKYVPQPPSSLKKLRLQQKFV